MIKTNLTFLGFEKEILDFDKSILKDLENKLIDKKGLGSDFLGWINWPNDYDKEEYSKMKQIASRLRKDIDVLLVVGIGGSYLGTRAADNMIRGLLPNDKVQLIYVGNTISSSYIKQVLDYVENKEFAIVNASKSGTTTEPGISFRVFQKKLIEKKGKEIAKKRIVAVTDKSKGALKKLSLNEGYETFVIPDDIGGRFSVFTPVGLFPLMVAGVDTDLLMKGSQKAFKDLKDINNEAYKYAVARYLLNTKYDYKTEVLVSYEMQMQMYTEWWKQLFGESEGKDNKGLLPSSCIFSTDLHSLGQFIQDGTKNVLFETIIDVKKPSYDLNVPKDDEDLDGLNYLTSKSFHEINQTALKGVIEAHVNTGQVPNIILEFDKMDAEMFGYSIYWFMRSCAISGYLLDINPFDQPGVEVYKKNMFKLLKKPGF
ncbi:glucose-6-phosphate isomerase [Spiroplasma litorale]|uniref:Glucose-6-phosphate isomerase n=1 Tax=Spiroplasma litorale TaxID=216942 RepID=A0A0K1W0P9_9MOLU|nr:glucose-6-phosphate isomerase [Spiroplasma litorale]AKX33889.1 glucose-6-phosphate isomerase [Spiroplasma litorale]